jgi:hypothetical protein
MKETKESKKRMSQNERKNEREILYDESQIMLYNQI